MAYTRKTKDEFNIEVNYGVWGWEHETTETSWKAAKAQARIYRENISYPVRIVKKRVKISP